MSTDQAATRPHNEQKITPRHKRFILMQVAAFESRQRHLAAMLADEKVAGEYGFKPITVSHQRVRGIIAKIDPAELERTRAELYRDFSGIPLAHKRNRLMELQHMYDDLVELSQAAASTEDRIAFHSRMQTILKHVRDEIGEDIDKLADALRAGGVHNHFNFVALDDEKRRTVVGNIASFYRVSGN